MGIGRTVAAVFGVVYVLVGIVGFFLTSPLLGLFPVNPLHNIVHIVLGAILLYGAMSAAAATMANRLVGAILVVVGLLGIVSADGFRLLPLGGNDILLHLGSGVILLAAGFFYASEPAIA